MNLKGKTALVTGGATGLGLAIAKKLLEHRCKVVICGRTQTHLNQTRSQLNSPNLTTKLCDVTDYTQIETLVQDIGFIDILINNAGVWLEGELETYSAEKITQTLDINLKGVIYTTRAALPQMKKRNDGYIVNISSTSGLKGRELQSVYVASKFGVHGFTESLKVELASTNVKVIGIYPGGMNTKLFAKAGTPKDNTNWMDPNKVAEIIVFTLERDESLIMDHVVINKRTGK